MPAPANHLANNHSPVPPKGEIRDRSVVLPAPVQIPLVVEPASEEADENVVEDGLELGFDCQTGQGKKAVQDENGWWLPVEMEFEDGVVLMVCGEYVSFSTSFGGLLFSFV